MTKHDYNSIRISRELLTKIFSHITIQDTGYKTECWVYHPHNLRQYVSFYWKGEQYRLQRLTYALFVGFIAPELEADHLCFIPACVNPAHIEAVTPRTNVLRSRGAPAINAKKTHCPQGHPLSGDNLILEKTFTSVGNRRKCLTCKNANARIRARERGVPPRTRSDGHLQCIRGHSYPENLYVTPKGYKICRACSNLLRRERRQLQAA